MNLCRQTGLPLHEVFALSWEEVAFYAEVSRRRAYDNILPIRWLGTLTANLQGSKLSPEQMMPLEFDEGLVVDWSPDPERIKVAEKFFERIERQQQKKGKHGKAVKG